MWRQADEHGFLDFKLEREVALLATVKMTTDKPERASNTVRATDPDPGSNDQWKGDINGAIAPSAAGDLVPVRAGRLAFRVSDW